MSQARQYELVYIVSPDATEQEITDLHTQVESIVARLHGEMVKTENWGRRKMAYQIGKHREGTYVLEVFSGAGDLTKELDRRLKVSDLVIRHLIVRVDEELRVAERDRNRRQALAQKRAERRPAVPRTDADADGNDDDADEGEE